MPRIKRIILIALVVVLAVPMVASAKKMKRKGIDATDFQVGADLGANIFGFIPYADATVGNEEAASFSGSGGFGPVFGIHANLYPAANWIIHADAGYANQGGTADIDFENEALEDQEDDYALNLWRFSLGAGQKIIPTSKILPYWLLGLSVESVRLRFEDDDDPYVGTGLGPFGALGVDVQVTKMGGMYVYAGGQLRMDLIYTVTPLDYSGDTPFDQEIKMGYIPFGLLLTGGVMF